MATKKAPRRSTRQVKSKNNSRVVAVSTRRSKSFVSRPMLIFFALVLGVIGAVLVYRSFAASVTSQFWSNSVVPTTVDSGDRRAITLGLQFKPSVSGTVSAIRFYKASTNTGTHIGKLWSASGAKLGEVTFVNETSKGWQTAYFAQPIAVTAGTTYVASYYTPTGHYSRNEKYFSTSDYKATNLVALRSANGVRNGLFGYGNSFPTSTYNGRNYWVDLVFNTLDVTTPTPPPVTTTPPPPPTTTTPPPLPGASTLRSVSGWESLYLGRWNTEDAEYQSLSTSADEWDLYDLAYGIDANVTMFQATGKTQYLDRALKYTNNAIATAKPSSSFATSQYKDSYLTWVNHSHPGDGDDGREYPLFESYGWRYVTNMLVAMKQNQAVYTNPSYKAQFDTILSFTEKNIFDKWYNRGTNSNLYRSNTHMASHWAMISLDLSMLSSDSTRLSREKTVYENIDFRGLPNYSGNSLRKQLQTTTTGAYFWNSNWGQTSHPGQDTAHGNGVISYVVHANSLGSYWTAADMEAFTKTLNTVIWPSASTYGNYVDGTGSGTGWFNDGFMKLGRFDVSLQKKLESHTVGRNIQFYANGALNAKLIGAPL